MAKTDAFLHIRRSLRKDMEKMHARKESLRTEPPEDKVSVFNIESVWKIRMRATGYSETGSKEDRS